MLLRYAWYFRLIILNVLFKFSSFQPDYLYIYDGPDTNAAMIISISGNELPDDLYSTGSDIFLHFQSDDYYSWRPIDGDYYGFKIRFSAGSSIL